MLRDGAFVGGEALGGSLGVASNAPAALAGIQSRTLMLHLATPSCAMARSLEGSRLRLPER